MTIKLLISNQAENDLQAIKNYIEEQYFSERAGVETVQNIINGLRELSHFPEAGFNVEERIDRPIIGAKNYRGMVLGQYIAFYDFDKSNERVEIDRVLSSHQNWISVLR